MDKKTVAKELYKTAEVCGVIELLHEVFGKNISVSIPFSKTVCETPVETLELSRRSANALMRNKLFTIGEIVDAITQERLAGFRNLGRKSLSEIKTLVLVIGYSELTKDEKINFWEEALERNCK